MTKVNSFDVNLTIDSISDYAPLVIFVIMVLMFTLTGWMQYNFLTSVFSSIPGAGYLTFLFPIVLQILRFVTGFLSASFFKKKRWAFGLFVFCFSMWLSVFEFNEVHSMADFWANIDLNMKPIVHSELKISITKEIIEGVMTILIWGALVLEFFLAAWLGKSENIITPGAIFSTNGAVKKPSEVMS
jgi:hypothetical protein